MFTLTSYTNIYYKKSYFLTSFLYIPRAHYGLQYIQQEKIENSHHYFAIFFFFKSVNNEIVILINFLKKMRLFVEGKKNEK